MKRLMSKGLNPMQLAIVYKQVLEATKGTEASKDREAMKRIIKEEYHKLYPNSYMPVDDKEDTMSSIFNNYGRVEELAISLGLSSIDEVLACMAKGANKGD